MRCEEFLERLDGLDAAEGPDRAMRAHAGGCARCAEAARLAASAGAAARARRAAAEEAAYEARAVMIEERVMSAVRLVPIPRREYFSLRDWVIAGTVIFSSIALIPFGNDFSALIGIFGTRFALPLALVLGLGMAAYAAVFVGTHLEAGQRIVDRLARPR